MDKLYSITISAERKRGQHLQAEDRGALQALKAQGYSNRAIAKILGCSPTTVGNELKRGTPPRKSSKGKDPSYSAKRGEAVYKANRKASVKPLKVLRCKAFLAWVATQVRDHKWSLDACCGYAKLHQLFPADEMVCTHTLYNMVWADLIPIKVMELPEAVKRRPRKDSEKENKRRYGTSISQRPEIASLRTEVGHWEGDTVVGKRDGKEAVVLSLLEKKTQYYIALRIPGKTSEAVMAAMRALRDEYGEHFADVFKTITVDNGSEFADFSQIEEWETDAFFAHPFSSWERAQNERHNGLFRAFVPKGQSIEPYSEEDILAAADELNGRARKKLEYRTPEELFEAFLDSIYVA
jgi:IS30 family transposase